MAEAEASRLRRMAITAMCVGTRPAQTAPRNALLALILKCKPWTSSVKASKSKTMQEVIEFTTELMEDKTQAYAERQAERKRKNDDLSKNNQNQQNKRQNTGQAYTAGNSGRKSYVGSKPLCSKCNYNHEGPCPPKCSNCKRVGHATKDCRIRPANNNNNNNNNHNNRNNNNNNNRNNNNNNRNNNNNNQQGNGCFECGAQGHFKRNCPRLRNNDRGNQAGNDRAPAKVLMLLSVWHGDGEDSQAVLLILSEDFIEGFSKIAQPNTKLTQKKVKFVMGINKKQAFQLLKQKLMQCTNPLHYLNKRRLHRILRHFKKELVSLMVRSPDLETYLYGTRRYGVYDHKSFSKPILDSKELNKRQRRWLELLSDYDCDIRYHPGKANVVADAFKQERTRTTAKSSSIAYDY
ncbi:putative reverse transcriptase domain-containing protein [Tanacetum coccineum]